LLFVFYATLLESVQPSSLAEHLYPKILQLVLKIMHFWPWAAIASLGDTQNSRLLAELWERNTGATKQMFDNLGTIQ